jgi:hypothetical protein
MDIIEKIWSAGLIAEDDTLDFEEFPRLKDQYRPRYYIAKPSDNPDTRTVFGRSKIPIEDSTLVLYQPADSDDWVLRMWEYVPGPGPTDFVCSFRSPDEAIAAVTDFFFGTPTTINKWMFPLHRHPELKEKQEAILQAIKRAPTVSPAEFKQIQEQNWQVELNKDWGDQIWERAFASQFLCIPHQHDSRLMLQLRRDLQIAYIVSEG